MPYIPIRDKYAAAFTLIELSIVLIIIGLLAGGIVTGQSLIHTAQLRNQAKQITDYQIAFNTFITKYNCVPGDCANATTFFGVTDANGNALTNGNGNGSIDTNTGGSYDCCGVTWGASTEMYEAFEELAMAHMTAFTPSNASSPVLGVGLPPLSINAQDTFFFGASYNFSAGRIPSILSYQTGTNAMWLVGCANGFNSTMNYWDDNCGIFTAADLQAIDQKIDDGMPLGGKLFGFGGNPGNDDCLNVNGSASTYKTTNTTPQCQATFILN